ncbi:hypothetical protein EG329_003366 [Mollisiaceae sp. DMI_Dod_QoI]|nr:hypothetical protein EG329_003366 [Helotiales sp. DMI_Dod_QoI]
MKPYFIVKLVRERTATLVDFTDLFDAFVAEGSSMKTLQLGYIVFGADPRIITFYLFELASIRILSYTGLNAGAYTIDIANVMVGVSVRAIRCTPSSVNADNQTGW